MSYWGIIIIILLLIICIEKKKNVSEYFKSSRELSPVDKKYYNVVSGFDDKKIAATKLANIHSFIIRILDALKKKFVINKEGDIEDEKFVTRILNNYNIDTLFENDPLPGAETSYVVNKGDRFALCLREKHGNNKGSFHSDSLVQFVALHELTHLGNLTYGHRNDFWERFHWILVQAKNFNLYEPQDYSKKPVIYCGLRVSKNPYFNKMY